MTQHGDKYEIALMRRMNRLPQERRDAVDAAALLLCSLAQVEYVHALRELDRLGVLAERDNGRNDAG
jgi:hypothetical protein